MRRRRGVGGAEVESPLRSAVQSLTLADRCTAEWPLIPDARSYGDDPTTKSGPACRQRGVGADAIDRGITGVL